MLNKKIVIIFLLLISVSLSSQDKNWFTIAKKDVSYKTDKDVIKLKGDEKNISQFKLKCIQGTLKIKEIFIYYKDKSVDDKKIKGTGVLTKGMKSFTINVDSKKSIDRIELSYEAVGNMLITKRAKIELIGRKK